MRAIVGLGSNVGDRAAWVRAALVRLRAETGVRVLAVSSAWEAEPLGAPPPAYLNAACEVATALAPERLLARLHAIEAALGRRRSFPGAPRTIDLDLLLYGARVIDAPGLRVPHPRLRERAFALAPLCEIAPRARDPRDGTRLRDALAVASGRVARLGPIE